MYDLMSWTTVWRVYVLFPCACACSLIYNDKVKDQGPSGPRREQWVDSQDQGESKYRSATLTWISSTSLPPSPLKPWCEATWRAVSSAVIRLVCLFVISFLLSLSLFHSSLVCIHLGYLRTDITIDQASSFHLTHISLSITVISFTPTFIIFHF